MTPVGTWVDSHCHVQGFDDVDAAVDRAVAAGVGALVCVGTDLATSRAAVALAHRRPEVFAAVGLHPHEASRLDAEWDGLVALVADERVVAVGETGFDLYYEHSPPAAQEDAFRAHVELAAATGRALVIHTRDAWEPTFRVLGDVGVPDRTVFHCFTGGSDEAQRALEAGAHLSFSGIVTFANAADVRAAAAVTPLDRLLVETDSPYLAPEPHRGRRNEPAHVAAVGAGLAASLGRPAEEVAAATTATARRVFSLA